MRSSSRTSLERISSVAITLLLANGCSEEVPLDPVSLAVGPPTNLTATAVAYDRIYVAWQDNARNENGWEVHRSTTGPSGAFSLLRTLFGNAFELVDLGLQGSTQYCYKVRNFRTTRPRTTFSEFSNVGCATTPVVPIPPTPTNLDARPICCHGISLTWTGGPFAIGFRVERATSSSGPWDVRGTTNVANWFDGTELEQTFCYRVIAFSGAGESGPSAAVCSAVPIAPSNLVAVGSGRDVNLSWIDNSGVEDGYLIERSSQTSPISIIATLPPNATAYRDAGLSDNQYQYQVRAKRNSGGSIASNSVQVVVASTPPAPSSGLSAMPVNSTSVMVSWVDGSTNENGFRIERSTNGGATWTAVGQTGMNFAVFHELGLSPDAQVCYRVIAFNNAGESAPSNTDCTTPPAAPTQLTATGIDAQTINLAWRDNSAVEDGYGLQVEYCYYYYGYYQYCYWSLIAEFGPNTTSYQLRDASAYFYSYAVVALKDGGYSTWSNLAIPTPPPSGSAAGVRRP